MAECVIVGASLTGATAAIALREHSTRVRITLIGAEPEFPYERPPLSKTYLRGEASRDKALIRPASFYQEHGIELMLGTPATRLDAAGRAVELADGRRVPFDALLVATGAHTRDIAIPGGHLPGVYSLRTIDDADRMRQEMIADRRAVIVGMGFIGSEVAASCRLRGVDVAVIDPGKVPLGRLLGETVGRTLADLHRAHGVRTIFEDRVDHFEGDRHVVAVVTKAGVRVPCDFAVAGIGVEPATGWLDGAGLDIDNGVIVDEYCRTAVPGIFAAGDVANFYHPLFGRRMRIEHWQNAIKQGTIAARNMLGERVPCDDVPWFWSDQYDTTLQYAGFHTAWQELVIRGDPASGHYVACYLNDGRVDAVAGINRPKDVRRLQALIRARRPVHAEGLRDERVGPERLLAD